VTAGEIDQPSAQVGEQRIREDEDPASLGAAEIVEGGIEVALSYRMHDVDLQPKRRGRCLRLRAVGYGIGIARIDQNADHTGGRHQALQQLQLFRDQRVGEEAHAGNIAHFVGALLQLHRHLWGLRSISRRSNGGPLDNDFLNSDQR
jgi:hypothetical protein